MCINPTQHFDGSVFAHVCEMGRIAGELDLKKINSPIVLLPWWIIHYKCLLLKSKQRWRSLLRSLIEKSQLKEYEKEDGELF